MGKTRRNASGGEVEIVVLPGGDALRGPAGVPLLDFLQDNGVPIGSSCGGRGTCGECRVRFAEAPPLPTSSDLETLAQEEVARGWRLACQHTLDAAAVVEVPPRAGELDHKAQDSAPMPTGAPRASTRLRILEPEQISGRAGRTRSAMLAEALGYEPRLSVAALRRLGSVKLTGSEAVAVITDHEEILDIRDAGCSPCGLAVDVGTTTLAVYLLDLRTGQQLGVAAARNPQRRFGADVISRIAHVRKRGNDGLVELHTAVVDGLNELVDRLTAESHIAADAIYGATIVGNPTMLHLLLSVNPVGIDVAPYVATFTQPVLGRAEEIGLAIHPNAVVSILPSISAYVGADIIAGIIATKLHASQQPTLFLDVGTNGEIVLADGDRLVACSTAAGPAFEGASLVQGMPALHGAIESVRVQGEELRCDVIGGGSAAGMCGTGLLSAVATLYRHGAIDPSGRISTDSGRLSNRVEGNGRERRIRLADGDSPVCLHQQDVREFQLGKAAMRTGIERLLEHCELDARRLERILVGGAFSTRLSRRDLVETGLVPQVDPEKIRIVGNTAGRGAQEVLLDFGLSEEAVRLSQSVEYLELSGDPRFAKLYVDYIPFPGGPSH